MKHMKKVIFITLLLLSIFDTKNCLARRFNPDYAPIGYVFDGLFAFHSGDEDVYYALNGDPNIKFLQRAPNSIPNNPLPIRISSLPGLVNRSDSWKKVILNNGTVLILVPQTRTEGLSPQQKKNTLSKLTYVVIERSDDVINIYLYNPIGIGNKLVFDIPSFEDFVTRTWWYNHSTKESAYAWNFGFEFYPDSVDFVPEPTSEEAKKPSVFSKQYFVTPIFNIDLSWKNGAFSSLEWLAARIENTSNIDQNKVNKNVLFDNNIVSRQSFVDTDFDHVKKILTNAGYDITPPPAPK